MHISFRAFASSGALFLLLLPLLQGCSKVNFKASPSEELSSSGGPAPEVVFKQFKPTLAARAAACTACHAEITSTVITDYGIGSSAADNFSGSALYNREWAPSQMNGSLIVPIGEKTAVGSDLKRLAQDISEKTIFIGAPTEADIRLSSGLSTGNGMIWKGSGSGFSSLPETGVFGNTGDLLCEGDLAVAGVVRLRNLRVSTTKGCRIYATKTIFVNGGIQFIGGSPDANLQLVSARAVMMGMSVPSLIVRTTRLTDEGGVLTRQGNILNAIAVDAAAVGPALVDADVEGLSSLSFSRVLLNAPIVQSRYSGLFQGTIIAEFLLMRVGFLKFAFDPVFERVPVLPLTGIEKSLSVR